MSLVEVKIKKLPHAINLPLPSYGTLHSAGVDLLAAVEEDVVINSMERFLCPTGISIALPIGFEAQIRSRSGLAYKNGIIVINSPGTIDADYRGEIFVPIMNLSKNDFVIQRGNRIAQMIISQFTKISWNMVEILNETNRGENGFGSTGQ